MQFNFGLNKKTSLVLLIGLTGIILLSYSIQKTGNFNLSHNVDLKTVQSGVVIDVQAPTVVLKNTFDPDLYGLIPLNDPSLLSSDDPANDKTLFSVLQAARTGSSINNSSNRFAPQITSHSIDPKKPQIKKTIAHYDITFPPIINTGSDKTVILTTYLYERTEESPAPQTPEDRVKHLGQDRISPTISGELELSYPDSITAICSNYEVALMSNSFEIKPDGIRKLELTLGLREEIKWNIRPKEDAQNEQDLNFKIDIECPVTQNTPVAKTISNAVVKNKRENRSGNVNGVQNIEKKDISPPPFRINVTKNWIDWTYGKIVGLGTVLTSLGLSIPIIASWRKNRRKRKGGPAKTDSSTLSRSRSQSRRTRNNARKRR